MGYNMKINVAFPATGCQKLFEINDEIKVRPFYEKCMGQEVDAATLGDEWAGYIFRITGGNDKQGFPMKQGVLTALRVRLLSSKGHSCYRQRRSGERKRKSVRGCIVDGNLSVISVVIVKKGDNDIPGLTDTTIPRRLGPKRASKIRKLFNLTKDDNVCQYVIKRPLPAKEGKKVQDPQAFQLDQGRQRVPVRDQEAPSSKGGQESPIQSSQGPTPCNTNHVAKETSTFGC